MALEVITVTVLDDTLAANPLSGVVVRVYDETGTAILGEETSDGNGQVQFMLDGDVDGINYRLYFHATGAHVTSPQMVEVFSPAVASPTGTNNFQVEATLYNLPTAANPRLCRVSGYVRQANGMPAKGVDLLFIPRFNPLVVDDEAVLDQHIRVRTDKNGWVSLDLYRNGLYDVTVETHENVQRCVVVPDRSSMNLGHLLFPVVSRVEFDIAGPWALNVGDVITLTPTVTATDYQVLTGTATGDVIYSVEDLSVAGITVGAETVEIRGMAPGTTRLRIERSDPSVVVIPFSGITGDGIDITVS